jgi:TrmH family RNA methyltransferase
MLSKNEIKYIQSLQQKKQRTESGCFVAEGNKLVHDLLPYMHCAKLIATQEWIANEKTIQADTIIEAGKDEIKKASNLPSPPDVLAIFRQPDYEVSTKDIQDKLTLALDCIQDPGNLGTIVRLADWFGIENIICSEDTADIYNPNTVQATMGALARVKVHYKNVNEWPDFFGELSVYGTFLDGDNFYQTELTQSGIIVMGNEGKGIRSSLEKTNQPQTVYPQFSGRQHNLRIVKRSHSHSCCLRRVPQATAKIITSTTIR